ncbi:ligand-binding sensor domain-containing protein [Pedobacter sp. CAN_A7]|uniref:ligand-binding sensor domain-containing protein n=1 Tax=Pedobacter sp. CAN_A7 TaxID=2787722 RepID=UPI0018CAB57C
MPFLKNGAPRFLLFLLCLIAAYNPTFGEDIKSIGVPYIENYTKGTYQSGNQNWSIAKSNNGVMHFGNAQGLLIFDGKYWKQYEMPNRQIVRAVATDDSGKVYTGSYGDFGYWSIKHNRQSYTSLKDLLPGKNPLSSEVWKIYPDGDRVLFQSFSDIYIYKDHKITVVTAPGSYLFLHQVNNRFIVEVLGKGLFELKGNKLSALKNESTLLPADVLSILPYKNGKLLIGTRKNALYLYDGKTYRPFETPASPFLKAFQLNNGTRILNKYYAYGTILNGIIIIDENGRIIQQINKSSGLQNNTILSLHIDKEQNLWAGLDNGIDRIELNSPLYFYFDKAGRFGTVYSSIIYNGNIYLGTNQGLFYSKWAPGAGTPFNFQLIPQSQGQVWELMEIDGQLFCGHNEGTFRVADGKMNKVSGAAGGWTLKKLKSNPDYLIQGTYNGLVLFKKDINGAWRYFNKIENFGEPSRYVEQDGKGDLWVSHAYKGLYRLTLSSDLKKVISTNYYDEQDGLPSGYNIHVFPFENKLVYSSDNGFYLYDEVSNRFNKYQALNKKLGSFANSNKIIPAGQHKYWFINHGKTGLADFSVPGEARMETNRFSVLDGRMVQYYENISKISESIYLISVDDGFVVYNESPVKTASQQKPLPAVLVRMVYDLTDTDKIISENGNAGEAITIPYQRNNIRITYALPYYRQAEVKYQFKLEGYSKHWSDWSSASQKDFTNLGWGKYRFLVKARSSGQVQSKITVFEFEVLPPFYATKLAFVLYVFMLLGLLFLFKKLYERKLLKDKLRITEKLQLEKEEILKREADINEKQIARLEREKLQAELSSKNREIANSAMSLVYKNELLQKLSQEISKLKDGDGKTITEDQQRKIQHIITEGMNDERDWVLFENSFNDAHESFFKKLKAKHPDLVPNDLKLCAFLHMNMSSKEMASLLNISLRGVEIRRYRLRKKLNIPHDMNLTEFLMSL